MTVESDLALGFLGSLQKNHKDYFLNNFLLFLGAFHFL